MDSNKKSTNIAQVIHTSQHNIKFEKNLFNQTNGTLAIGQNRTNYDLTSLFECPVCFDYVTSPILQCKKQKMMKQFLNH